MGTQPATPSELARETLKTLGARKTPPTPDNYAKIYAEISGNAADENSGAEHVLHKIADLLAQDPKSAAAGAALKKVYKDRDWEQYLKKLAEMLPKQGEEQHHSWSTLIRDLLRQLETPHKGLTSIRKKEGLNTVLKRFSSNQAVLFEKLNALQRSWSETPAATNTIELNDTLSAEPVANSRTDQPGHIHEEDSEPLTQTLELLAQTLESMLTTQPELTQEIKGLVQQVRSIKTYEEINPLAKQLRPFWLRVELSGVDKARINEGLVRLLRLLVENVGDMVENEDWLHGQVLTLQEIIANPISRTVIADAERSLRDTIIKQGMLKQSLDDAKSTIKSLMTTLIDRLGELTESTGDYHQKIEVYSQKIGDSKNLIDLNQLLGEIMYDTRIVQVSALRSHDELINLRKQIQIADAEIINLQQELAQVSELVREDQLTGALNRRGLDAAFTADSTRADRNQSSLCVALLDIDDFKRLNDTRGHHAGDQALIHLSKLIKETLRPSDSVARYGGEEFAILLPDVSLEEAAATIERLQRELTKKYFMHENDRVLVTFSAGVALRAPQESQEEVLGRADKAMYQAKRTGKNRVIVAK